MDAGSSIAARFTWHPQYAGRTVFDVRRELVDEITADQKALALALDAAEAREDDALESVLRLERKWSDYDLNWAETDPGDLADRILAWNWEQERRHELFPYSEVRDAALPSASPPPPAAPPPSKPLSFVDKLRRWFGLSDNVGS
jgi:hypothetical protein